MLRGMIFGLLLASSTATAVAARTPNQEKAAHVFLVKMGKGDFTGLDRIYGPGFKAHGGGQTYSLDEDNASGKALREAAPDVKVSVERMVEQGDLVAVQWRAIGHNSAPAAGMPGNGKPFDIEGMTFFRFDRGKIVEEWSVTDWARLMKQLAGK